MPLSVEEVRALAKPWTLPVHPDAPAGTSARELPLYQRLLSEVGKLQSPNAGAVSWTEVSRDGEEVLVQHSKDLLAAAYLAHAQQATRGLPGLLAGIVLLRDLLETYWESGFPEPARVRARANALEWFVARTVATLPALAPTAAQRDTVEALPLEATALAELARRRFEGKGPALGPLVEALERLKQSLPPPAPEAPAPGSTPAATPAGPAAPTLPTGDLSTGEGTQAYARELGAALLSAGNSVRRARSEDPLAYRLSRQGLWLAIAAPPPADAGGKSRVPAPTPGIKDRLQKLVANAKWPELLDEAEGALAQNRLWLDLQRLSAQALGGLGPGHAEARTALMVEVAALLRRLGAGTLEKLSFADGTPLADAVTRAWIDEEVAPATQGSTGAVQSAGGGTDRVAAARDEARGLLARGKSAEALALLHGLAAQSTSGHERFEARLALAEILGASGQLSVSRALYASLDAEGQTHGLDSWNPPLAAQCLEGLLSTMRQGRKANGTLEPELDGLYKRLCRLDPAAAMKLGF